jgi:hypothetical protein
VIPDAVRALAESPAAYGPEPSGGFERVLNDRYCVLFGPVPSFTSIWRPRLRADEVEKTVTEVRELVAERGHVKPVWWVGSFAQPPDLAARLVELGFRPNDEPGWEPRCTAMALVDEPPAVPGVTARRVESFEEFVSSREIGFEAFGTAEAEREEWRAIARERYDAGRKDDATRTYLAWHDGRPVATAMAVFGDAGALLIGGGTLADARGRGAYRALVRARWDDAVARGTPALVVNAGAMSRPILERLGFQPVAEIEVLLDADA